MKTAKIIKYAVVVFAVFGILTTGTITKAAEVVQPVYATGEIANYDLQFNMEYDTQSKKEKIFDFIYSWVEKYSNNGVVQYDVEFYCNNVFYDNLTIYCIPDIGQNYTDFEVGIQYKYLHYNYSGSVTPVIVDLLYMYVETNIVNNQLQLSFLDFRLNYQYKNIRIIGGPDYNNESLLTLCNSLYQASVKLSPLEQALQNSISQDHWQSSSNLYLNIHNSDINNLNHNGMLVLLRTMAIPFRMNDDSFTKIITTITFFGVGVFVYKLISRISVKGIK